MSIRRLGVLVVFAVAAISCGDGTSAVPDTDSVAPPAAAVAVPVAARVPANADPHLAGEAISAFGTALFTSAMERMGDEQNAMRERHHAIDFEEFMA